jgi:hypothetical protein
MACDYYIQSMLIIEYICYYGKLNTIQTNISIKNCHYDENKSFNTSFVGDIERNLKSKKINKIYFENDKWTKDAYKHKYEKYYSKKYPEINKIVKIYKKNVFLF